jgi:formate dehydrogenase major subunit
VLQLSVNGQAQSFKPGATLLEVIGAAGVRIPTLCHDERVAPIGACRLCLVEVQGSPRPVPACNTAASDRMVVQTHTPEIEQTRRTILQLLANQYPAEAAERSPDEPFHRLLSKYGINPIASNPNGTPDESHPYIRVDMSRCIHCYRCVRICDEVQGQSVWRIWNRGDTTEIRPDSGTTLAESSCVACGACADTCPTGAIEDKPSHVQVGQAAWTRTTCPYCGTGCEMNVGVANGRIVGVKPVLDAPVSKGHLCVKGRYAYGFNDAPDRVTDPMIREGGRWKKVGWDDAIYFAASALQRIVTRDGPSAVGVLGSARATNEENYLTQKFARVVLGTNNVDCCARVCHAPSAAGMKATLGTSAATNSFDDIERAKTILICGANPTENHPIVGARIKRAARAGTKLIVIDPRRIELAEYTDCHLQLRPGTNVLLLNAMACVIVEEGLIDDAFVRERVNGWDGFRDFVGTFRPEAVAATCGVDADLIRRAARLYATAKPAMTFHGLGLTEHVQGTDGVECLVNLALLTGNVGCAGAGVNPLRGQNNVQGAAHMGCEPASLTGGTPLPLARAAFEDVWHATLPDAPGLNLMQMVDAAKAGQLKAMWAIGYDIALTNPNAAATRTALESLELLIVQDLFLNRVSEFAHVFFPAASSFEKDGTFMNGERRVQRVRKVLDPPGQARPDWKIICDLARAMGRGDHFAFVSPREVWDEVRAVWPAGRGITYERLDGHGLQWPCPTEQHPGTPVLHEGAFTIGPRAPLQRIAFIPLAETPSNEYPFILNTGRTLYLFNAGTMSNRTANAALHPADFLDMLPGDADLLGLQAGDRIRVTSRHGTAVLPVRLNPAIRTGELFTTFHMPELWVNELTGPQRDTKVDTPAYKVTAVRLERVQT